MGGLEFNYTIIEKEFLVVLHVVNKFRNYIIGYHVFVHIDHDTIRYLMNKLDVSSRVIRWLLLLQEIDLTIVDKPGRHNVVVYFLSRLTHTTKKSYYG